MNDIEKAKSTPLTADELIKLADKISCESPSEEITPDYVMAQMEIFKRYAVNCKSRNVIDYVLDALREKQEREKDWCEYCMDEKVMPSGDINAGFYLAGEAFTFSQQTAADDIYEENTFIRFCPMCGRKLGGAK